MIPLWLPESNGLMLYVTQFVCLSLAAFLVKTRVPPSRNINTDFTLFRDAKFNFLFLSGTLITFGCMYALLSQVFYSVTETKYFIGVGGLCVCLQNMGSGLNVPV